MAADRHEVNIKFINVNGYLSDGLGRVSVEKYFLIPADLPNFLDGLNHTDFIVDHYNWNEDSIGPKGLLELFKVNDSISLHRKICDIKTLLLQVAATVQDTFVIYLCCYNMFFLRILAVELSDTLNGQIVALCCSTCEDNFFGRSANQGSYIFSRLFTGIFCVPPVGMWAGMRITKAVCQVWQHRIKNSTFNLIYIWLGLPRVESCRCLIIEVQRVSTLWQRYFQLYIFKLSNLTFVEVLIHGRHIHSEGSPHMHRMRLCLRPAYQVLKLVQFRYHF